MSVMMQNFEANELLSGIRFERPRRLPRERQAAIAGQVAFGKVYVEAGVDGADFTIPGFDRDSPTLAAIKAGATSWRALNILYNRRLLEGETRQSDAYYYMTHCPGARAIRNRLKVAEAAFEVRLRERAAVTGRGKRENPLTVVSLAAGSAEGVLRTIRRLRDDGIYAHVTLVDNDASVENLLDQQMDELGIDDTQASFVHEDVFAFMRNFNGRVDIVEMMGFIDYLTDRQARFLISLIYRKLDVGGHLLTCNIHPGADIEYLEVVLYWRRMIYRTIDELVPLVQQKEDTPVVVYTEPYRFHSVVATQKQ